MDKKKLIPELHDAGKLLDKGWAGGIMQPKPDGTVTFKHNFCLYGKEGIKTYDFKETFQTEEPGTETWKGIKGHHDDKPANAKLFLLKLADGIASAVSRAISEKDKKVDPDEELDKKYFQNAVVFKLWKWDVNSWKREWDESGGKETKLINTIEEIKNLLAFLRREDLEGFFTQYKNILKIRPEDFKPPLNITSLASHMKTTGKIYRFLEANTQINRDSPPVLIWGGRSSDSVKYAEKQWKVQFLHCKVKWFQRPFRTKDLWIYETLENTLKELAQRNNVLFCTSDEFLAFLGPSENITEMISPLLEKGFYVEVELVKEVSIEQAFPTPRVVRNKIVKGEEWEKFERYLKEQIQRMKKQGAPPERIEKVEKEGWEKFYKRFEERRYYEYLPLEIPVDRASKNNGVCIICQMRPAEYEMDDEKSGIKEELCKKCYEIRTVPGQRKLHKLASERWESGKIAWIKVLLDINRLSDVLQELNLKYWEDLKVIDQIRELIKEEEECEQGIDNEIIEEKLREKATLRFSVLEEFFVDYKDFLNEFRKVTERIFSSDSFEFLLGDLFCIRIEKLGEIIIVLKHYLELINKYFPKFIKLDNPPLKLSLSCSYAKFPFFEHQEILNNPKSDVYINLVGKGEIRAGLKNLEVIVKTAELAKNKTALHKLARVAEVSERLAEVILHDKKERDSGTYIQFERPMGLGFQDILTLMKIIGDRE